jgi:hypothetical protein
VSLPRIEALLTNGTDWDPDEVKWINERYRLCWKQALDYILRFNVSRALETVSFPGEHLSYLEVVKRVIIDCTEWELAQVLREIGLNPRHQVYYKAKIDEISIEKAEEILLEMLNGSAYVVANEFLNKLGLPAKSATYTTLKKELTGKGWTWKSKKVKQKVIKVIER